jgi:V8-like Glu-specific endopeptidase
MPEIQIGSAALPKAPSLPARIGPVPIFERFKSMFELALSLSRHPADPFAEPFKWVTLLNFYVGDQQVGHATGFLIESDLVVTAAHNLLVDTWETLNVYPAMDQQRNPVSPISAVSWAWYEPRDCAVLVLSQRATSFTAPASAQSRSVTLAGYAYPYPDETPRMTYGTGECEVSGRLAQYKIATRQGDSGAPVYVSGPSPRLMAMHSKTQMKTGGPVGVGELIDNEFRQLVGDLEREARAKRE